MKNTATQPSHSDVIRESNTHYKLNLIDERIINRLIDVDKNIKDLQRELDEVRDNQNKNWFSSNISTCIVGLAIILTVTLFHI